MARQKNNIIMRSTHGMFGKQIVFKRRAGRSYVAAPPEVNENRKATLKQLAVQQRFKTSIAYAKAALTSIELKEAYDKVALRGQSAFNVAFKDAFNAPEIVGIVAEGYQGVAGNVIVVHAKDDFKVNAVKVSIRNSADELISNIGIFLLWIVVLAIILLRSEKLPINSRDTRQLFEPNPA